MTSRHVVYDEDNTLNRDEKLSNQVLCDDEFEKIAPRSEILENVTSTTENLPTAKEPIEIEKVVPRVRKRTA